MTSINAEWHSKHKMPKNPTLDQRLKWHLDHARHCACRPIDGKLLEELKTRYLGTHQEFWIFFNRFDHQALALWAAECAERVLPIFTGKYPQDTRPGDAIHTLREWVTTGEFSMPVIRGASLGAHAAARNVMSADPGAGFAARAAGQAAATAHVPTHASGAALYALKAIAVTDAQDIGSAVAAERMWQIQRLPENLRQWVETGLKKNQNILPKKFRINSA